MEVMKGGDRGREGEERNRGVERGREGWREGQCSKTGQQI